MVTTRPARKFYHSTATIAAEATTVVVTHNLGSTPNVFVEAQSDLGGRRVWVDTKTTTQFTINIDSADPFDSFIFEVFAVA